MNGCGKAELTSRHLYWGDCKNNKLEGYGTLIYPSGDIVMGQFLQNLLNGYGFGTWSNGDVYHG